jgi:tRNA A37 threonylcarbamoyladenosine modification protein TsaB
MIILAVDASTKSSGFSVFDNNKLIHYECTTASSTDVIKRIYKMVDTLSNLIQ